MIMKSRKMSKRKAAKRTYNEVVDELRRIRPPDPQIISSMSDLLGMFLGGSSWIRSVCEGISIQHPNPRRFDLDIDIAGISGTRREDRPERPPSREFLSVELACKGTPGIRFMLLTEYLRRLMHAATKKQPFFFRPRRVDRHLVYQPDWLLEDNQPLSLFFHLDPDPTEPILFFQPGKVTPAGGVTVKRVHEGHVHLELSVMRKLKTEPLR